MPGLGASLASLARVSNYGHLFIREDGLIRLKDDQSAVTTPVSRHRLTAR